MTITLPATRRQALTAISAALLAPLAAHAQAQKLCRFYVGFPAGGSTDVVARLVAAQSRGFADTTIVENQPGAAGRLALMRVRSNPPDGATVLVSPAAMMTLYPHVYTKLAYDPRKDFVPVTAVGTVAFTLVVSQAVVPAEVRTLDQLGAWLRANPEKRSYASGGAGTPMHFIGAMVAKHLRQELTHVAYRGAAPMVQDLAGGQIAMGVTVLGDALPHIEGGRLRAIAVSSPARSPFLAQVPTFGELGAPQIVAEENFGLYLPAGAAADTVQRLAASVKASLATPEVQAGLSKLGCAPTSLGPAEFAAYLERDLAYWQPVVKATGFSLDE